MSHLRVHSFSISIDDFGAGPNQDLPESARSWRAKLRTLTQPLPAGEETECKGKQWSADGGQEYHQLHD